MMKKELIIMTIYLAIHALIINKQQLMQYYFSGFEAI